MRIQLSLYALVLALTSGPVTASHPVDDRWLTDLDTALARAADGDRYILVDLYAEWCGWCKVLEKDVFSTPEFLEFTRELVLLRVDVDDGGEGTELQARFEASSLPTTLVMDANMAQVAEVRGYFPSGPFLGKLAAGIEEHRAFLETYEEAKKSDDPRLLRQLVQELGRRKDGLRAAEIYERLEENAGDPVRAAWLRYLVADAYRFDRATTVLEEARNLARRAAVSDLLEKIDMMRFYIAQESGNCEGAKHSLARFLDAHPQSVLRAEAEKTLAELEKGAAPICA